MSQIHLETNVSALAFAFAFKYHPASPTLSNFLSEFNPLSTRKQYLQTLRLNYQAQALSSSIQQEKQQHRIEHDITQPLLPSLSTAIEQEHHVGQFQGTVRHRRWRSTNGWPTTPSPNSAGLLATPTVFSVGCSPSTGFWLCRSTLEPCLASAANSATTPHASYICS